MSLLPPSATVQILEMITKCVQHVTMCNLVVFNRFFALVIFCVVYIRLLHSEHMLSPLFSERVSIVISITDKRLFYVYFHLVNGCKYK